MTIMDTISRRTGLYRSRSGMIFGVCKGIAEYFGFSVFWTRVIAIVVTILTGFWPGIIIYFLAALAIRPEPTLSLEVGEPRRALYRSRSGMIFGVCKGIAEYLDFSVFWTRVVAVALLVISGFWFVAILYLLAALIIKPEPILPFKTEEAHEFYNSYVNSRSLALHRLKRTFDNLDRRIQHMESIVTAREFDWERRLNEGS